MRGLLPLSLSRSLSHVLCKEVMVNGLSVATQLLACLHRDDLTLLCYDPHLHPRPHTHTHTQNTHVKQLPRLFAVFKHQSQSQRQ